MEADWSLDNLIASATPGARVERLEAEHWRLSIPAGGTGGYHPAYRLAELDDYRGLSRRAFLRRAPFRISLRARASQAVIPGTWGFGLWNDPFGLGIGSTAQGVRLPALPNAAWFFFASPPNFLSLRDDLPGRGGLAAAFRSRRWPAALLALGAPAALLLALPATRRWLRRLARRLVEQDATALALDPADWHAYSLEWWDEQVHFEVDGQTMLRTEIAPQGPLGLVIWVDNQFAAFPPDGRLRFGTLPNAQESWIEVIRA